MWKRCLEDNLRVPITWETQISDNGNNAETWEALIDSGKLNYMAALRNLRNIVRANPRNLNKVLKKIADPIAVRKSKQLPFRYLSAYKALASDGRVSSKVFDALEAAVDASVDNLPKLRGKTVIAVDVSGSMGDRVSNDSNVLCCEIGMLLGVIANRICDDAIFYEFDNRIFKRAITTRCGILYTTVQEANARGGTNMELPFEQMIKDRVYADRIIVISDNECNGSYWRAPIQSLADDYRRNANHDLWVHAIDLQGYGTQQFYGKHTNVIAGWSEKVFDFILLAEQGEGTLEKTIENYRW